MSNPKKQLMEHVDTGDTEDLEDFDIEDGVETIVVRISHFFQKYKSLKFIILIVLLLIVLVFSFQKQKLMEQEQEELRQQLDRQNLIIDSLEEKQKDSLDTSSSVPVITSETLKSQLGPLNELVTQEYVYTNADRRTDDKKWIFGWTRPFSGNSLLLTYDGVIKASVDLNEAEIRVDEESRTIFVDLPDSYISENDIPQESIVVVEVKDGLFNEVTLDDYNSFISEQKIIMKEKAIERGLLTKADEEARSIVRTFLSCLPFMSGEDAYKLEIQ